MSTTSSSRSTPGPKPSSVTCRRKRYGLELAGLLRRGPRQAHRPPGVGTGLGRRAARADNRSRCRTNEVCGGDNATWVNLMANWIASHHVVEATYWDYGTSSVHRGHNPLAAAVLATHFGLPK